MKTCEAMASLGHEVVLFYGKRFQSSELKGIDPYEYHDVEKNFGLRSVPVIDVEPLQRVLPWIVLKPLFILMNLIYAFTLVFWTMRFKADIYYTREWMIAMVMSFLGRPVIVEVHQSGTQSMSSRAVGAVARMSHRNSVLRVVTISEGLKQDLISLGAIPDKITVARGAVDIAKFDRLESMGAARTSTGLPNDKPIVMYTGHLTRARGVCMLIETARLVPEANFVIIGGTFGNDGECESELATAGDVSNIIWVGRIAPSQVAIHQAAADILVLPQVDEVGQAPMKLYEYLASKRPVVASDIAPFREVVEEGESAVLFRPGDAILLAASIRRLLEDKDLSQRVTANGYEIAKNWTWVDRALKVLPEMADPA
jgi:glycosyltransferase involved in cell wall biosynthesis